MRSGLAPILGFAPHHASFDISPYHSGNPRQLGERTMSAVRETKFHGRRKYRTPEAAEYTGVSEAKLAKLRVYGGGPRFARLGRAVIYDPDDLDAWINSRKVSSTSEGASDAV